MWQRPRQKQLVEIFFSFDYYDVDLFYFIYLFFGRWSTFCICNVPKIHRTNKKNKKRKGCLPRGWHGFGPNGVPWYHVVPWLCLEKLVGIFLFFSFFGDHEFMILKKIIIIIINKKKRGQVCGVGPKILKLKPVSLSQNKNEKEKLPLLFAYLFRFLCHEPIENIDC